VLKRAHHAHIRHDHQQLPWSYNRFCARYLPLSSLLPAIAALLS
jgi:hypothetical protein